MELKKYPFLQIIPDPVLKNTQLVSEEISEDMASAKEELDEAVPIHTLLDVSANRSKAELAHKGLLSQRQRPSTEALRATVLRKSVSTLSSASDSGFPVRIYLYRFSGRSGRSGSWMRLCPSTPCWTCRPTAARPS